MSIEKHRAFIDSLEGEKGLPEEMHGLRLDMQLGDAMEYQFSYDILEDMECTIDYLIERCRRAESRQIPDLKEKVKELMRDAMASERIAAVCGGAWAWTEREAKEFRALCAPDKGGEVKP